MLRHPEYCGLTRDSNGELIPLQDGLFDRFPVTKAEWRRAQALLGDRDSRASRPKKREYAFNGLVRCGYCGKSMLMAVSPNNRGSSMVSRYRCPGGQGRMNDCQFATIKYSVREPSPIGTGSAVEAFDPDTFLGHAQRTLAVHPAEEPSSNAVVGIFEAVMPLLAGVCLTTINDEDRPEVFQERIAAIKENIARSRESRARIVGLVADGLVTDEDARGQLERLNGSIKSSEVSQMLQKMVPVIMHTRSRLKQQCTGPM